jgi:hypothetical protein
MDEYLALTTTISAIGGLIVSIATFLGKSYFDKKMKNLADIEDQRHMAFEIEMGKSKQLKPRLRN